MERLRASCRGDAGGGVRTCSNATFTAGRPFENFGTDVTEHKVAGGKAYLAPVYDMASKGNRRLGRAGTPTWGGARRLLAMLEEARSPWGANPILHSDMGWQYQHPWWRGSSNGWASASP